jgi:hypothetical protein
LKTKVKDKQKAPSWQLSWPEPIVHVSHPADYLCGTAERAGNANARLPSCSRVKRNVGVELRCLGGDLRRGVLSLSKLNLQAQDLKLQLQDLVLYFAIL